MKATRVIDNAAPPTPPREADSEAATHVLDLSEDKTSPPPVSARKPRSVQSAPTPIDNVGGLAPGMVLFGEYEIVNVLGVGGRGEV